ncbi:hypothetical protein M0R04_12930 [Candidatus Dojkabacteria bacterium]|jgi:hypothetical protein|nr:hypothetical protein [Candidatus Dojkabacteria bacterium]
MKTYFKKDLIKKFKKQKSKKSKLGKECKDLWTFIVKARANWACEVCGKDDGKLDAHHFFTKGGHPHLKYDIENGMALCFVHHTGGREGAHHDPLFTDKILGRIAGYRQIRTEKWYQSLIHKSQNGYKLDLNLEKLYLEQEANKYEKG